MWYNLKDFFLQKLRKIPFLLLLKDRESKQYTPNTPSLLQKASKKEQAK
jgi:hypothetical protein